MIKLFTSCCDDIQFLTRLWSDCKKLQDFLQSAQRIENVDSLTLRLLEHPEGLRLIGQYMCSINVISLKQQVNFDTTEIVDARIPVEKLLVTEDLQSLEKAWLRRRFPSASLFTLDEVFESSSSEVLTTEKKSNHLLLLDAFY